MGGCASKPANPELGELEKPPHVQTDVIESEKGKPSASPPNGTTLSTKQQMNNDHSSPAVSTAASAHSSVKKQPLEHDDEVRTVVSAVPVGYQRDASTIISLDEANSPIRSGPSMVNSFNKAATQPSRLSNTRSQQQRYEPADSASMVTPRGTSATRAHYSPVQTSPFATPGASAVYADTPLDIPDASRGQAAPLRADENPVSATRMSSTASTSRWQSGSNTPRTQSGETGRPRWNSTAAAAAAQARKGTTPPSLTRQARVSTPRRRTAPVTSNATQSEPPVAPGFMAATRASSSKLIEPVASPASARAGRHPYGLMEPPTTAV